MTKMIKLPAGVTHITTAPDIHAGKATTCVFGWDGKAQAYVLGHELTDVVPVRLQFFGPYGDVEIRSFALMRRVQKAMHRGVPAEDIYAMIEADQPEKAAS